MVLAACLCACSRVSAPSTTEPAHAQPALTLARSLPGSPWVQYRIDASPRSVEAYLIHDDTPKPVVVMLQGSGCVPLFTVDGDQTFHGTTLFEDLFASRRDRLHFVLIEKQGVSPLQFTPGMTRAEQQAVFKKVSDGDCSPAYYRNEMKSVRVDDVRTVLRALHGQPWARQILLVGHSEGSRVAAGVVHDDDAHLVSAAGLFSSATISDVGRRDRKGFEQAFAGVQDLQGADDDAMIDGHAGRRWKSYTLGVTPLDDLRESRIPLYVAHGGREPDLAGSEAFALQALRQQARRPLRYVVVEDGDHAFADSRGRGHIAQVFDDFVAWALDRDRVTGTAVLK